MRLVVRAAEVTSAPRLLPITGAHVDSCLDHGQASLDFIDRLAVGDTRVAVPTTLNVGGIDLLHPELWRGDRELAARGRAVMEGYRGLGCRPTFTCAPYELADQRPGLGEQVAWGESNAIVFVNSVLGARTSRYGDFLDVAAAVTGRVPESGLHLSDARRARLVLRLGTDVPDALLDEDSLYPILGAVIGRRTGSTVAAVVGLPAGLPERRLKALGAAAASTGSVALVHVVGSTPEAPTLAAALQEGQPDAEMVITLAELRSQRTALTTGTGSRVGAVSLGTPHASYAELEGYMALLGEHRCADTVELLISTGRETLHRAEASGIAAGLRRAGAELLVDTCSYIAPILRAVNGVAMTDSAKWAYYAPGNIGVGVVFATTAECLASAVAGRVVRDDLLWGEA